MKQYLIFLTLLFAACNEVPPCQKNGDLAGNTLNVRLEAVPNNLNPYLTNISYSIQVCTSIFNTLGLLDPKTLEMKPALVTAIPDPVITTEGVYKGCFRYDFAIQPSAVWDNGTPVTANDVLFTLKVILNPELPTQNWASYFSELNHVTVDSSDPKKFSVFFKKYYILALESLCAAPILPAYQYDGEHKLDNVPISDFIQKKVANNANVKAFAEFFKQPKFTNDIGAIIGSGAYKLVSLGDQGAVVEKKQNWWGDALVSTYPMLGAYPQKIAYKAVKDEAVALRMIKDGTLDIAVGLPAEVFVELQNDKTLTNCYDFVAFGSSQYSRWLLNNRKPELADPSVRRALAHIVNYDEIIGKLQQNMAERLVGPILPRKSYYNKSITPYPFDINKANTILEEAGWKDSNANGIRDKVVDGQAVELDIELKYPGSSQTNETIAKQVEMNAKQAGVKISLVSLDITKITPDTKSGNYESAFTAAGVFAGLDELYSRYHSLSLAPNNGDNRSGFVNKTVDEMVVAIRNQADAKIRDSLYQKLQVVLHEQLPEIYMYAPKQRILVSKRFDYVVSAQRPGYLEMLFKLKDQPQ